MEKKIKVYTKEELIAELRMIRNLGFVPNARPGNVGGVGNTLEDLLQIEENNLPLANSGEWEIKVQRRLSNSLKTLFHMEPSPRALKFVPQILLPFYGWPSKSHPGEMSFRQTISGEFSDRGFGVVVNKTEKRVELSFNLSKVSAKHKEWLKSVRKRTRNLGELNPKPYWGFDDLFHKAGVKLLNCCNIYAEVEVRKGLEHYHYKKIQFLSGFKVKNFLKALENGNVLIDFDARTGHNHGTKFRIRPSALSSLYASDIEIDEAE
jgi:hypothetical protein